MPEKLFFLEGPSGSGKTKFANALQRELSSLGESVEITRGMPSQKDDENARLPIAVRNEVRGLRLNFHEASRLPIPQLEVIKDRLLRCGSLLFKGALNLRDESAHDILVNRSGISQTAIFLLAEEVASERGEEGDGERVVWARQAQAQSREALLNDWVLARVNGIIHLEKRVTDAPAYGRGGMTGLEEREGYYISSVIDGIREKRNIPLLRFDINDYLRSLKIGQEITMARDFIRDLQL